MPSTARIHIGFLFGYGQIEAEDDTSGSSSIPFLENTEDEGKILLSGITLGCRLGFPSIRHLEFAARYEFTDTFRDTIWWDSRSYPTEWDPLIKINTIG